MFEGNAIRVWLLCACLMALNSPAFAAQGRPGMRASAHRNRQAHHAGEWLRKYRDLPPGQQEKALESDPDFQRLPPARQEALRRRLERFNSLPPKMQQRILDRMETWEHLTPAQKQDARGLFQQFQSLPPERRSMIRGAILELRRLPPDQRQQMIDSDRYKNQFTPQERNLLRGVSELPLAPEAGPANGGPGNPPDDQQ